MRRSYLGSGVFALAAIGLFALYRNRNSVRGALERQGIRVPHRDEIMDRIRVGTNRVINRAKGQVQELKERAPETLKEVG